MGQEIYEELKSSLEAPDTIVLAPDGPFPVAVKKDKNWELRYAWYFFDRKRMIYYLPMKHSVNFLLNLLKSLQLDQLPTQVIGYSQGGYLAPFLAKEIPQCKKVTLIGSRLRSEELVGPFHFDTTCIHGKNDEAVDYEGAKICFDQMIKMGMPAEWISCESGHRIDPEILEHVKKSVSEF